MGAAVGCAGCRSVSLTLLLVGVAVGFGVEWGAGWVSRVGDLECLPLGYSFERRGWGRDGGWA